MNATTQTQQRRQGFTLVELLVVITIIGIIAGIAIPAVMGALTRAKVSSMKTELESFHQAIEAYKNKHGDYPPDFSNWNVVQRHYTKIFPDIADSELTLLYRLCDSAVDNSAAQTDANADAFPGSVMDRAEALVWALGGFSSDPERPFSGTGGPLIKWNTTAADDNPAAYQYNVERDNRFVDFDPARLSVLPYDPSAGAVSFANRTRSADEPPASFGLTGTEFVEDIFPSYVLYKDASPAVYFDARTYGLIATDTSVNPPREVFNGYARFVDNSSDVDAARPLMSEIPNAAVRPSESDGTYISLSESVRAWTFVNPQTFQILSPGIDRRYGPIADIDGGNPGDAEPVYFQYSTGALIRADDTATSPAGLFVGSIKRYDLTAAPSAIRQIENHTLDNITNFCPKTLGDNLP